MRRRRWEAHLKSLNGSNSSENEKIVLFWYKIRFYEKKKILNIMFSWGSIPRDYFRKESLSSASLKYIISLPLNVS